MPDKTIADLRREFEEAVEELGYAQDRVRDAVEAIEALGEQP